MRHLLFYGMSDFYLLGNYYTCDYLFFRVREFRQFSEKSDVYSFGVFLLELVSGQEARDLLNSDVNENLVEWV